MAKATRTRTAGANRPVPQTREEAATAVARIGELGRAVARIEADLNDELTRRKEAAETAASPLRDEVTALTEGLKIWAEANRSELTAGGKTKSADIGTGVISWRLRPPKVSVRAVDQVIELLRARGFRRFLRTKVEINKEALLAEPDVARTIAGISIGSKGEDFIVEPFEVELSAVGGAA
ncbi:host-nuclease inhibitor Gam family protein [Segnochrobactrum spirostomi]|uniref:Host-nuclease inhibitor protein Gam n=1 Tax=Segnochrobactrum spirostomi TaxID=2608987 RepID=A0A6A7Y9T8_9HYPH|nr:host-nuclease inhibitor Gam family protein [Segnochrobactrum spirostomi]MQT14412.1 host-nuclease inhibitor protein Gam [Segnochrobactrum spirostomi]